MRKKSKAFSATARVSAIQIPCRCCLARGWTDFGSLLSTLAVLCTQQRCSRVAERLALVEEQIARVEAERDAFVLSGEAISMVDAPEGSQARAAAKIATLTRLTAATVQLRSAASDMIGSSSGVSGTSRPSGVAATVM